MPEIVLSKLRHVIVFHRHGDRTPLVHGLGKGFIMSPEEEEYWKSHIASVEHLKSISSIGKVISKVISNEPLSVLPESKALSLGQLTRKGVRDMRQKGKRLREECSELFIEAAKTKKRFTDQVYVMSTNSQRTIDSVKALLSGFFAEELLENQDAANSVLPIQTHENNCFAPAHSLSVFFELERILKDEIQMRTDKERESIGKLGKTLCQLLGLDETQPVPWTAVRDTLSCRKAHKLPFPTGLTENIYQEIVEYDAWLWHQLYSKRSFAAPAIRQAVVFIAVYIEDIVSNCKSGQESVKMSFFSVHDNSIVALINAFKVNTGHVIPGYASTLAFELVETEDACFFIRATFEGERMLIGGTTKDYLCPYKDFLDQALEFVKEDTTNNEIDS